MPRLQVLVGPDRFHMEPCRLNDTLHPHEIETEHFVGRVLVRILGAPGAREGEPGREYFLDRSRKFCIQIEGRFKQRWNGNDILFGSDFDKFVDFPSAPFNAGMKVAKFIDPCTFYEFHPSSGRPYIMSPYIACMNTVCAWPAPSRAHDAVVVLRHTHKGNSPVNSVATSPLIEPQTRVLSKTSSRSSQEEEEEEEEEEDDGDGDGDVVPVESLARNNGHEKEEKQKKKKKGWLSSFTLSAPKEERVAKKYWRFVGFKDDARVRALLEAHQAHLTLNAKESHPSSARQASTNSTSSADVQHGPAGQTLSRLGMGKRREAGTSDRPLTPELDIPMSPQIPAADASILSPAEFDLPQLASSQGLAPLQKPKLERIPSSVRHEMEECAKKDGLKDSDFKLADALHRTHISNGEFQSKLDDQLGPWRFTDPGTDMIEDNAFIFTNQSRPVPKRRKHFANEKHRQDFTYDPDVVYGTSFFTDAMDFNTFNLGIGPVRINVSKWFADMPVRYTLRSTKDEELTFATISFQLVD